MKVSYNWLSEYVDLSKESPLELAEEITLTGIEVEEVDQPSKRLAKVVVGEVLSVEKIENADHLNVTQVTIGEGDPSQIVCGAPNVKAGQKVIVALPGAELAGGLKIKKSKLRGTESNGMLCSLDELGFSESVIPKNAEEGIFILPEEAKAGEDALPYLGLDDSIIEFDITPNRADALSMRGVAHEVGAILSQKPVFDDVSIEEDASEEIENWVNVGVEDENDSPIYKMRVIKEVEVKESPLWMQRKLMHAGIRPIDAVVDVTNYIMLEYGQPLHAFDYDALETKDILVRRAEEGEKLVTLDGQERTLTTDNLVITNGDKPVGLAGVMGGENTHVTKNTQTIALESAVFESALIRKTAHSLNLRSESSSRFEKGVNRAIVEKALDHAAALIASLGNGKIISGISQVEYEQAENKTVATTLLRVNDVLGTTLSLDDVKGIMDRLGFDHIVSGEEITVTVPPRRWDIEIEADIIEEVARIYGYNNIPSTLPSGESLPGALTRTQQLSRFTQHFMEGAGLSQAISYALTTEEKASAFSLEKGESVTLDWPMSEEHKVLRESLISGLLDTVQYNVARQNKNVRLYEIGRVFYSQPNQKKPDEINHVAGVLTGATKESTWEDEEKQVDYYAMKGIVEEWFEHLGQSESIQYVPTKEYEEMHPGRTAEIIWKDKVVGFIGQLHPSLAAERDLTDTIVFEINTDTLFNEEQDEIVFTTIPKYPGTSRDVALVVDETVLNERIVSVMKEHGGKWLNTIHLFDLYQGENIEEGKKSLAYSLSYLNPSATLKEKEVNKDFDNLKEALVENVQAEIR